MLKKILILIVVSSNLATPAKAAEDRKKDSKTCNAILLKVESLADTAIKFAPEAAERENLIWAGLAELPIFKTKKTTQIYNDLLLSINAAILFLEKDRFIGSAEAKNTYEALIRHSIALLNSTGAEKDDQVGEWKIRMFSALSKVLLAHKESPKLIETERFHRRARQVKAMEPETIMEDVLANVDVVDPPAEDYVLREMNVHDVKAAVDAQALPYFLERAKKLPKFGKKLASGKLKLMGQVVRDDEVHPRIVSIELKINKKGDLRVKMIEEDMGSPRVIKDFTAHAGNGQFLIDAFSGKVESVKPVNILGLRLRQDSLNHHLYFFFDRSDLIAVSLLSSFSSQAYFIENLLEASESP